MPGGIHREPRDSRLPLFQTVWSWENRRTFSDDVDENSRRKWRAGTARGTLVSRRTTREAGVKWVVAAGNLEERGMNDLLRRLV